MHLFRRNIMRATSFLFCTVLLAGMFPVAAPAAELKPAAVSAWDKYVRLTETRINEDLAKPSTEPPGTAVKIRNLRTNAEDDSAIRAPSAVIHHWKGSVLVPGVRLDDVLRFVKDYDSHERYFKEVERSRLVSHDGNIYRMFYRLKRTKVLTVVYNTEHTVVYASGPHGSSSRSTATKLAELEEPGTESEREKLPNQDHGFLWRLNSYWRFTERDGGVLVECESISLSRSIPFGFGWMFKGFVESVPRESLLDTLTSLRDGVTKLRSQRTGTRIRTDLHSFDSAA